MQCDTSHLPRCSCSALFETDQSLRRHLDSVQNRVQLVKVELQTLVDHVAVTASAPPFGDGPSDDGPSDDGPSSDKPFSCPSCPNAFKEDRDLRRHYQRHVPCKALCVYCRLPFDIAIDLLSHGHTGDAISLLCEDQDMKELNKLYMRVQRETILKKVAEALRRAKAKRPQGGDHPDATPSKMPCLQDSSASRLSATESDAEALLTDIDVSSRTPNNDVSILDQLGGGEFGLDDLELPGDLEVPQVHFIFNYGYNV